MATKTRPDDNNLRNVGQRHSDDLFNQFEREFQNPSGSDLAEQANIDRAKAALRSQNENSDVGDQLKQAESAAANAKTGGSSLASAPTTSLAKAESQPGTPAQAQPSQAVKTKGSSGRRTKLIGFGAGGGVVGALISLVFGLQMKLIDRLEGVIRTAEARIEKMIDKRFERFFVDEVLFKGTKVGGKDLLQPGNPIGDELKKHDITMERSKSKITVKQGGKSVGEFKNASEFQTYLNGDGAGAKEIRTTFASVDKTEWSFFKRANVVSWLRNKYNVKFGDRTKKDGETDDEYNKAVNQNVEQQVGNAEAKNVADAIDCVESGGANCAGSDGEKVSGDANANKAGGGDELKQSVDKAVSDSVSSITSDPAKNVSKTIAQRIAEEAFAKSGGAALPGIGEIDTAVRIIKTVTGTIKDDGLQKAHAAYNKRNYITMFATMAGYADMTKAGDLPSSTTGMLAGQYDGAEDSQSWNFIQSGELKGQGLSSLQKIDDGLANPQWLKNAATVFDYATFPVTLWFDTVSKGIDLLGSVTGNALSKIPGINTALAAIGKIGTQLFIDFLGMVGMAIDPQVVGPLRHLITFAGGVAAFNDQAKGMGGRKLTHAQAVAVDNQDRLEQRAQLADESFSDRLFNLDNQDSLAYTLLSKMPTTTDGSSLGNIAFASASLLAQAPTNFANIFSPGAMAASDAIPEDIGGSEAIGGTGQDTATTFTADTSNCPTTADGSTFNTCLVDKNVKTAANCVVDPSCPEIQTPGGADTTATSTVPTATGSPQDLANQILALNKQGIITFEDGNSDGALHDIQLTANGGPTQGCGNGPVALSPDLLRAIVFAAGKYKFRINALTSDHNCTDDSHSRGMGVDFGLVDGQAARISAGSLFPPVYAQFALYISQAMTTGGHINQGNEIGKLNLANGVTQRPGDAPTHLHVDVTK